MNKSASKLIKIEEMLSQNLVIFFFYFDMINQAHGDGLMIQCLIVVNPWLRSKKKALHLGKLLAWLIVMQLKLKLLGQMKSQLMVLGDLWFLVILQRIVISFRRTTEGLLNRCDNNIFF